MDQRKDDLEIQRTIGRLEAQSMWLASKVDGIDAKVDKLLSFKWQITGGAMVISIIVSALVGIFRR